MVGGGSGLIGSKIGEFEVLRRLGVGGMGAVYEGKHPIIGKRVAVKILHPHLAEQPEVLKRFEAEARAVNEIGHRGIVDIFSFGQLADGSHYFVMELLEGKSFEQLLKEDGAMPMAPALAHFAEILEAVGAAHAAKVIHRDLKTSNIFLVTATRGRPFVKVLDFGIAKLQAAPDVTRTKGGVMGTPQYMAPEQVLGHAVGPHTDVYALGVVLFEMLAGRTPFVAQDSLAMMRMQVKEPAPPLSSVMRGVPPDVESVVMRMLEKAPSDRPKSCDEVLELLKGPLSRSPTMLGNLSAPALEVPIDLTDSLPPEDDDEATNVGPSSSETISKVAPLDPLTQMPRRLDPASTRMAPPTMMPGPAATRIESPSGKRSSLPPRASVGSGGSVVLERPPRSLAPYVVVGVALLALGIALAFVFPTGSAKELPNTPIVVVPPKAKPKPPEPKPEVKVAEAAKPTPTPDQTKVEPKPKPVETKPEPKPIAVKPKPEPKPISVKPKPEPKEPKPVASATSGGPSKSALEKRLVSIERALVAQEKKAGGDKDLVLRRFLEQCRGQVAQAHGPAELAKAAQSLDELDQQIRHP